MPTAYKGIGFVSPVASGGVAHKLDTSTQFSSGKLLQVSTGGQERAYIDANGQLVAPSGLLANLTVEQLLNVLGDIQVGGVRASQLLADLDAGLTGNPTEMFTRTSSAYQWIGGMWRPVSAGLVRAAHFISRNGQLRRSTLIEPGATNQAPESCYFPDSGSGWSKYLTFSEITPVASAIEDQTAWRHTNAEQYASRSRAVGTYGATREWIFALLENVNAIRSLVLLTAVGYPAVAAARVEWASGTVVPYGTPVGLGHIVGMVDYGIGPNGGRLLLAWASAIPPENMHGISRLVVPLAYESDSYKTVIIHYAGHFVSDTFPGVSPIVTYGSAASRVGDVLYTTPTWQPSDSVTYYLAATVLDIGGYGFFRNLASIGANDIGPPGGYWTIDSRADNANLRFRWHDGNGGYEANLGPIARNDYLECLIVTAVGQAPRFELWRNGAFVGSATTSGPSWPGAITQWYTNRFGIGVVASSLWRQLGTAFHTVSVARGVRTMEEMRSGRGDLYEYRPGKGITTTYDLVHAGKRLGFFGNVPATRATVTGSKDGNAALASLISALAGYGLIVDGTT